MCWGRAGMCLKGWALRRKVRLVAVRLRSGLLHNRVQIPHMTVGEGGNEMVFRGFGDGIEETVVHAGMVFGRLVLRPHIGQVDYRS